MFGHDNQDENQNEIAENVQHHPLPQDDQVQPTSDDNAQISLPQPTATPTDDDAAGAYIATPAPVTNVSAPVATDDLLDIKQEALQQLTPLVGHLEQTPEEQFRTTMMMIQASDNHSLIKVAYDAAKQITDEKERAQALLDIVNEINYFTQQPQN